MTIEAKETVLTNVLTAVIILVVIATIVFTVVSPDIRTVYNIISSDSVINESEYSTHSIEIVSVTQEDGISEIELLVQEIEQKNVGDKSNYVMYPDKTEDAHVCINMAIEQAEWIVNNRNYDVEIALLYNKHIGDNHVQTAVTIDGLTYVIDSVSDRYWDIDAHSDNFGENYKICLVSIKKGKELEKENNERINNKDEVYFKE